MKCKDGDYMPLNWEYGDPDAYYFKGHIDFAIGLKYLLSEEIIDGTVEIGAGEHVYGRWSMECGADGNQHFLRVYREPGRGRFKITEFGVGIFAKKKIDFSKFEKTLAFFDPDGFSTKNKFESEQSFRNKHKDNYGSFGYVICAFTQEGFPIYEISVSNDAVLDALFELLQKKK